MTKTATDLTYTERADLQDGRADQARLLRITKLFARFKTAGRGIERTSLEAVNLGREIGLELQGLAGAEQMGFSFFEENCSGRLPFNFDTASRFLAVARRLPEPVKSMSEATPAIQSVLFAAELITLPERDTQQVSHDSTPTTFIFHTLGVAWERIEKRMADVDKWDAQTRWSVRARIDPFEAKCEELKRLLE